MLHSKNPMPIRAVARMSDVSAPQATNVLDQLADIGLVIRQDVPPAICYRINNDHVTVSHLQNLDHVWDDTIDEIRKIARSLKPVPLSVILFGSMARRTATNESDIDIIFIRPKAIDSDDDSWWNAIETFSDSIHALCGNEVRVIEYDELELKRRLKKPTGFWESVLTDGIVLSGKSLQTFMGKMWQKIA